ncbi:MAG: hypothetical protein ACLFU4_05265 [Opitutales bacterium]
MLEIAGAAFILSPNPFFFNKRQPNRNLGKARYRHQAQKQKQKKPGKLLKQPMNRRNAPATAGTPAVRCDAPAIFSAKVHFPDKSISCANWQIAACDNGQAGAFNVNRPE